VNITTYSRVDQAIELALTQVLTNAHVLECFPFNSKLLVALPIVELQVIKQRLRDLSGLRSVMHECCSSEGQECNVLALLPTYLLIFSLFFNSVSLLAMATKRAQSNP
jgi:hypothetical protein